MNWWCQQASSPRPCISTCREAGMPQHLWLYWVCVGFLFFFLRKKVILIFRRILFWWLSSLCLINWLENFNFKVSSAFWWHQAVSVCVSKKEGLPRLNVTSWMSSGERIHGAFLRASQSRVSCDYSDKISYPVCGIDSIEAWNMVCGIRGSEFEFWLFYLVLLTALDLSFLISKVRSLD